MKFVISLGGSIIVPDEIDISFINAFKQLIEEESGKGNTFIIVTGGGKTARRYQKAALQISSASDEERDWLGIGATRINAQLMKAAFSERAYPKVVENPTLKIKTGKKIIIASGWKPGFSSDMDAVLLAKNLKADTVINLSNTDYVYDKDPKLPGAKPLEKISWKEFKEIVGKKWKPGMNAPFDPIASRLAEKLRLKVVVMNGKKLECLKNFLDGKPFTGSVIN
jgi:uridylate kinase